MSAAESLLGAEQRTLQMIAGGASTEVLDEPSRTIDAQGQGAVSSMLLNLS